jgi:nucleoid-associated protein YgaU
MAAPAPQVALREDIQPPRRSLTPLVVVAGLVAVAGIAALVLPGLISGNKPAEIQTASAPVPATPQAAQAPAIAPVPAAPKPAAPAADIPLPPQADKSAQPSPTLRPGSTQPDAPANTADEAAQPDVSAKPVVGGKYKVVRGDMLSDIALQVYGDAHKFRLIQAANPGIRHSPNRILVDQVIFIPPDKP